MFYVFVCINCINSHSSQCFTLRILSSPCDFRTLFFLNGLKRPPACPLTTEKKKASLQWRERAQSLTVEVSDPGPAPRAAGRHPSWGSAPILQRGGFRSAATPLPKRCAERPTLDHLSCTSSDIDLAQPTDVPVFSLSSRLPAHRPCCPGRRDDLVFRLQRGPHLP